MTRPRARKPSHSSSIAALVGVGAALGCTDPDEDDACVDQTYDPPPEPVPNTLTPTVSSGRWLSATTLELQFSAPLTSQGDVDAARFGLLGFSVIAYDQGYDTCYLRTRYTWLGTTANYYYGSSGSMGVDAAWIAPEDDTLLRLQLPIVDRCPPAAGNGEVLGSGVLLVYASGSPSEGALLDDQGDPLADIGVDWAVGQVETCLENAGEYYNFCAYNNAASGQLPGLLSLLEIPCP